MSEVTHIDPATLKAFVISGAALPSGLGVLDPIRVVIRDIEPGRGALNVECFGASWTAYWGAMGNGSTILQFLRTCDPEYVADNLIRARRQWISSRREERREMLYLTRISAAVIEHAKATGSAA